MDSQESTRGISNETIIETLDDVEHPLPLGMRVRCPFCELLITPSDANDAAAILKHGCASCCAQTSYWEGGDHWLEHSSLSSPLPGELTVVEDENGVVD